jgi:hypothetical protein
MKRFTLPERKQSPQSTGNNLRFHVYKQTSTCLELLETFLTDAMADGMVSAFNSLTEDRVAVAVKVLAFNQVPKFLPLPSQS